MKKNVIIALLAVVSVLSLSYGFYQKQEADKFEQMAQENERLAIEMRMEAEQQKSLAEQAARYRRTMHRVEAVTPKTDCRRKVKQEMILKKLHGLTSRQILTLKP